MANTLTDESEIPVVGIGYSAGGLEAIKKLLLKLPVDTGMAFVVIQHLKNDQESHLTEILAKCTQMPVQTIQNRMQIAPNTVFVIPPAVDVSLSGNFLNLHPRGESNVYHLGIDFFFSSLSQSKQSKAIGVILSGSGSDGTLGLKAIKSEGGITIIQDPETANFDDMPKSVIASGIPDLILDPESIALELARLATHPYTKATFQPHLEPIEPQKIELPSKTSESSIIDRILHILLVHTKMDFSEYKLSTIRRRIERQMMLRKLETLEKYAEYLQKSPDEIKALYEDIFIHVTDFFRDPESFLALREKVFPNLVSGKNKTNPIRIWIPGCATGEEVYSLAILLIEYLEEKSLQIPINLFGGDISEPALQKARKGTYAAYQMRSVSKERLERFFEPVKDGYKIKKQVRDLCIFSKHDVTSNPPIPKVDLISCRNVLIYFSADLQKRVFPVFHYALNPGGYLWLGRAESPESTSKLFVTVDKINKIFAKSKAATTLTPHFLTPSYPIVEIEQMPRAAVQSNKTVEAIRSVDQFILNRYTPPSVVIDHNFDILQFRGRTAPYLEPSQGVASLNLLKMANPGIAASLRMCVQAAKKQEENARKENISFEVDGKSKKLNIDVSLLNPSADPKERQYLVVFEDSALVKSPKAKSKRVVRSKAHEVDEKGQLETLTQYNLQLQQELEAARDYQQSLSEEYDAAQEELTSANEELRSTNEELQSTNEELHSTNEELGTAKEELQAANEELLSMNEELQKRNIDLEAALKDLEFSERRFRLMIESVKDYAIFMLDSEGRVATWNEGARRIKRYEAKDIIGKHFSTFYPSEDKEWKPKMELEGAIQTGRFEDEGWRIRADGSRFWANVVITALRDSQQKLIGFAKVTRDLTERKRAEDEQIASRKKFEQLARMFDTALSSSPDFHYIFDTQHRFTFVNHGLLNLWEKTLDEVLGKTLEELGNPPALKKLDQSQLDQVLSGKTVQGELSNKGPDGKESFYEYIFLPVFDSDGKVYAVSGTTRNATERKRLERVRLEDQRRGLLLEQMLKNKAAIENERENFRNLFKQTPEMVCILKGPDHTFEFVNEAHIKVLGFDATGMTVRSAQPESIEIHGILDEVYKTGKTAALHEIPVTVTDRLRYFNLTYAARRDESGNIDGIMILGVEVTQEVSSRAQLEQAVQARDEFLSIASHELKTPLTSLKLQTQIRKRAIKKGDLTRFTPDKLETMVESDEKQVNRIVQLVDDMLDVSRIQNGKLTFFTEQFDLRELVQDTLSRYAPHIEAQNSTLSVHAKDAVIGHWDRFRLEQVFVNLLSNALKYGAGKPIEIYVEDCGDFARLAVLDHGRGIAQADHERIFERFERVNTDQSITGLGLGLFISKKIIEAHNGNIRIESEAGKGSRFIVEIKKQ